MSDGIEVLDPNLTQEISDEDLMVTQEASEVLELSQSDIAIMPSDSPELPELDPVTRNRFEALRESYLSEVKRLPPAQRPKQAALLFEVGRLEEEMLEDAEAAFGHYTEAFQRDGSLRVNLRALNRLQLERGDIAAAIKSLDAEVRVCRSQAQRATLLYEKGLLQLVQQDQRGAESSFKRAMDMDVTFLPALSMMEHLAEARGDTATASKLLVRVAQICEDDHRKALIMAEVGALAELDNRQGDALDRYRIAIGYEPQLMGARFALERLYTVRGDWGALTDLLLQKADRSTDGAVDASYRFMAAAIAVHRLGEDLRAALLLEQTHGTLEDRTLALHELNDIYARQGKATEHIATLQRLLSLGEGKLCAAEQAALLFRMGEIYERLDEQGEGVHHYKEALARSAAFLPARRALIRALRAGEHWAEVATLLRSDADNEADPFRRYDVLVRLAELTEWQLESPDEAIPIYDEAGRIEPGRSTASQALDRLYTERQDWDKLVALLRREAEHSQDAGRRAAVLKRMAWIQEVHLQRPDAAAETLERMLEEPATPRDVTSALTRVYQSQKRFNDLVQNLEREAEQSDDEREILTLLCHAGEIAELHLADSGRARQLYLKVLARDDGYVPALQHLARLYLAAGYWDELVEIYRKELASTPEGAPSAILAYRIGQLLESKLGDDSAAERSFQQALQQCPDYTPALDALSGLLSRRARWKDLVDILVDRAQQMVSPDRRAEGLLGAALISFHRMGKVDEALALCQQAIEADRRLPEAHLLWEQLTASDDRFAELTSALAENLNDEGLARADRVRVGLKLAMIRRVHQQSVDGALEAARTVLALDPRNPEALYLSASLTRREGRMDELSDVLGRLADTTADPVTATADLIHLAAVLPQGEHFDAVRADIYDRVLSINPTHPFAMTEQERLARRAEDLSTLLDIMRRRAEDDGDATSQVSAWMSLGDLAWRAGDLDEAASCYAHANKISGGWLPTVRALRVLREAQERNSEVAELLEQEAEIAEDPDAVIQALMKAANIWLQSYMDTERAERLYQQVFERDPHNGIAFQRLAALLGGRDAHEELVTTYRKRITVADREEKLRLLMDLALLWEEQLHDDEEAAAVLEEVLRLDHGRVEALGQIAQIYRNLGRWRAATVSLERLVRATQDAATIRAAHLQRAELLETELGEDQKALESILEVLRLDPDDREALAASARLHERLGRWDGASEAYTRLAEKAPPAERARLLLELAEIYQNGLGQPQASEERMARAAALCSLAPEAVTYLEAYFAKREDPAGLDQILGRVLKGAPAQSVGIVPLRLARARNLADALGRHDEAEKEIRQALTDSPNSIEALLALGELHLKRQNAALAQVEYQGVLERDPFADEAYRGLMRVFEAKEEHDRARLTAQVLVTLGKANEEEATRATAVPLPAAGGQVIRPLGLDGYLSLMAPREDVPAARQLLTVLTPHLHLVFPSNEDRWGVAEGEDLPGGHSLKTRVQGIAAMLGVEEDQYRVALGTARPGEFALEQGPTPVVIVGQHLFAKADRKLDFLIGRALGRILTHTIFLSNANLRDLELTLAGVAAQYDRSFGLHLGHDEDLQAVGRGFMRQLPRKYRRLVEEPARDYAATDPVGMHAWAEAAAQGAARCGLLACADLSAAVEILRDEATSQEEIAGLCIFNISPRYAEARKRLGLSDD